jgi:ligand-binding sensor domain-containing protein/signal transduction histidine kinase
MPFGILIAFTFLVHLKCPALLRVFLVLLTIVLPVSALDLSKSMTQYAHRIWGQEEGLFQPTVYSAIQTHDGFLWLGTQDSLIRFDGIHFREFPDGRSALHGSLIRALAEDAQGNLWVAALGSGIFRISPDGQMKTFSASNGLPSNNAFCLVPESDGSLWACTSEGLVRIASDGIQTITKTAGLASNRIRATCKSTDGTRWVAGLDNGLSYSVGSRFVSFSDNNFAEDDAVSALQCDEDGSVWVGTADGLLRINALKSRRYSSSEGLPDNQVSALAQGPGHVLWVGTNDGISRISKGEVSVYRTRDGLSHSQVMVLFEDREGSLWAGTKNGLDQFTDGPVTPYTTNEGLLSNDVGPVLEDNGGRLWLGTLDAGLNFFDGHRFGFITTKNGLNSDSVLSLAHDSTGDVWVGTSKGLNRIHAGKVVAAFDHSSGIIGNEIRSVFFDGQQRLWIGTNKALQFFSNGHFVQDTAIARTNGNSVIALGAGRNVSLFASFDGPGLYIRRNQEFSRYPLESARGIDCFLPDPQHHELWMGTLASGLLRWKNDVISHVYVKDGLYDNRIYSILQDGHSNFWLASSKGIFRLSHQELDDFADGKRTSVTSLPFSTGQLRFECQPGVQPAASLTKDGRMWFSTTSGLVVLDPKHLRNEAAVAPPAAITALIANGTRLAPQGQPSFKPRDENNFEIHYAGLSFISPEKVTFRYRLTGYDRSWIDAGSRREAFYTNLPPGSFTFLVQARNADGVWSASPASLRFTLEPKLYQHWWFFPALLALFAAAVAVGYRVRIQRLRNRFNVILAERNRIARELHDTLLQGLSGVTMQLQALWTKMPPSPEKRALADIITDAGHCSTEARQSLWGLRNNSSSGLQFSEKLVHMARQSVSDRHISLQLRVQQVAAKMSPDVEYQLLRIASEAVTNSLKHASASVLKVILSEDEGVITLGIEDNGVGFAPASGHIRGHFGLQGMRERADEIGAEIEIESSSDAGTRVVVVWPHHLSLKAVATAEFEAKTNKT